MNDKYLSWNVAEMGSENEWDSVMSSILNEKQIVDVNSYAFQHELTTMDQLLNKSPALS